MAKEKQINFYEKVEELDKEWSEDGMTSDADDLFEELIKKYGGKHKAEIKKAVEEFYQITL